MATTTAAVNTNDQPEAYAGNGGGMQLRHIQLSRIVVPDGFNPRGEVQDDRELEQMAESIRVDGCLQPIPRARDRHRRLRADLRRTPLSCRGEGGGDGAAGDHPAGRRRQ